MQPLRIRRAYIGVGLILIAMVGAHSFGWLGFIENPIGRVASILFLKTNRLSSSFRNSWGRIFHASEIQEDYASCQNNLASNEVSQSKLSLLEVENAELRRQLDFKKKQTRQMVIAEIIGRELSNTTHNLLLNKGRDDGLMVGQPVIVGDGILVGHITSVRENYATVRLVTDSDSKIAATLLNYDSSLGVVEGGFGISLRMKFIPRNETVVVGDQVISSGLETNTPRGLLIGTVAVVENEAYQPFQQAILTPATNLDRLSIVSILVGS